MKAVMVALSFAWAPLALAQQEPLSPPTNDLRQYMRLDLGVGGTFAPGELSGGGIGASYELKLNVSPLLSVGFRNEGGLLFGGSIDGEDVNIGLRASANYLAKAELYPFASRVTPMFGLGAGYYASVGEAGGDGGASVSIGEHFGIAPQVGLQLGGFRLAATYHKLFGDAQVEVNVGDVQQLSLDYFAFEMVFRALGGRRTEANVYRRLFAAIGGKTQRPSAVPAPAPQPMPMPAPQPESVPTSAPVTAP